MPGNRAAAEHEILTLIEEMCPGSQNTQLYKDKFASMDDAAFERFIDDLDAGRVNLAIISPNFAKDVLSTKRNLEIAERLGHNFWQRIYMPAKDGKPAYLTPVPYLVVDLPLRRQSQLLDKKISIPDHNNSVDNFTGQVTGESKGSRMSFPEIQVLRARGLDATLTELLKYRGGDEKGFIALNAMMNRTGGASQRAIEPFSGTVRSTQTLKSFLNGMHLRSSL